MTGLLSVGCVIWLQGKVLPQTFFQENFSDFVLQPPEEEDETTTEEDQKWNFKRKGR